MKKMMQEKVDVPQGDTFNVSVWLNCDVKCEFLTDLILSQWGGGLIFVPTTSELFQSDSFCVHDQRVVMLGDAHRLVANNQQLRVSAGQMVI